MPVCNPAPVASFDFSKLAVAAIENPFRAIFTGEETKVHDQLDQLICAVRQHPPLFEAPVKVSNELYKSNPIHCSEKRAIVALGRNIVLTAGPQISDDGYVLSVESKLVALAAAELFLRNQIYPEWQNGCGKILFSTGRTTKNAKYSEAESMKKFVLENYANKLKADDILVETKSFDTVSNAANINQLAQQKSISLEKSILISSPSHLARADMVFKGQGLRFERSVSSISALAPHPVFGTFADTYFQSPHARVDWLKEQGLEAVVRLRLERFLSAIAKARRSQ